MWNSLPVLLCQEPRRDSWKESQRDSATKPRQLRDELPWVKVASLHCLPLPSCAVSGCGESQNPRNWERRSLFTLIWLDRWSAATSHDCRQKHFKVRNGSERFGTLPK